MTITQVLYFLEVVRQGSISRAAQSLFVSQPALSLHIKRLEEELGCQLLYRQSQGVTLTGQGQIFYRAAVELEDSWQRFRDGVQLLGGAVAGRVRIGIGARALSNGMFEAVAAFFERHPETEVTFLTDLAGSVLTALEEKRVNLALDEMPPGYMIPHPGRFFSVELLRERQCILLSRDDPRSRLPEMRFEMLQDGSFISGPEQSLDAQLMHSMCERYGVRMQKILRADSVEAMMFLIRSGKGVALGPASFARRYGVAAVPLLPETAAPLHLICLQQDAQNPLVVEMEQYLRQCLAAAASQTL